MPEIGEPSPAKCLEHCLKKKHKAATFALSSLNYTNPCSTNLFFFPLKLIHKSASTKKFQILRTKKAQKIFLKHPNLKFEIAGTDFE